MMAGKGDLIIHNDKRMTICRYNIFNEENEGDESCSRKYQYGKDK